MLRDGGADETLDPEIGLDARIGRDTPVPTEVISNEEYP
jgi:hypothetical protein